MRYAAVRGVGTGLVRFLPSPLTSALPAGVPGAVQVVLLGPKTVKLIVPVAFGPLEPASVAWSEIVPPAVACGVALVVTVGEALLTTPASAGAAQAVGPPQLLFRSPE